MPVEAAMCSRHCPEIGEAAVEEEFETCYPVEDNAVRNGDENRAFGKVFHQQREVVAEVEICLARRALRQGAASDVIDLRLRAVHHLVVVVFHAPAEVNLLHVGEEAVV